MRARLSGLLLGAWFWLVIAFLIFPLILLLPISLNASEILGFPPREWSLRWYGVLLLDPSWRGALLLSVKLGLVSTAISLVVGVSAAIAVVRFRLPGAGLLYGLSVAPLVVPGIVLALGLYLVLARVGLLQSFASLALAHAVVATPFVVITVTAALRNLDETLERAARVLGAAPIKAFWLVTLPALRPAMIAGAMFAFFASFDDLLITMFVGGSFETLPLRIWNDLNLRLDPTVAAAACVMVALSVIGLGSAEAARRAGQRALKMEDSNG